MNRSPMLNAAMLGCLGGLLVVVATTNYLEARVRADVARAYSDMAMLGRAMETYFWDNTKYMSGNMHAAQGGLAGDHLLDYRNFPLTPRYGELWLSLTSPVAYIDQMPFDPFHNAGRPSTNTAFDPLNDVSFCVGRYGYNSNQIDAWIFASLGPDARPVNLQIIGLYPKQLMPNEAIYVERVVETDYLNSAGPGLAAGPQWFMPPNWGAGVVYDPSNGLFSRGVLPWVGPQTFPPTPTPTIPGLGDDKIFGPHDLLELQRHWYHGERFTPTPTLGPVGE